jgi:DNA-binding PadR family transcriptional regulator
MPDDREQRRAPVYRLTRAGEKQLAEIEKWARLTEGVAKVLRFA